MNARRLPFPTALSDACEQCVGRDLKVELQWGLGWNRMHWELQPLEFKDNLTSGTITVRVERVFRGEDNRIRGFVGMGRPTGHGLDNLKAVLTTQSDRVDFDFNKNICAIWAAWFRDREPLSVPGDIPEFSSRTGYKGYGTIYENEADYREFRKRIDLLYRRA